MADQEEEKAIVPVNDLVIDKNLCDGRTHVGGYVTIKGSDEKSSSLIVEDFSTFKDGGSAIYLDQPIVVSKDAITKLITEGGVNEDDQQKIFKITGEEGDKQADIKFSIDGLFLKKAEKGRENGALLLSFSVQAEGDGIVKQLTGIELPLEVTAIGLRVVRCPDEKGTKERLKRYVDSLRS